MGGYLVGVLLCPTDKWSYCFKQTYQERVKRSLAYILNFIPVKIWLILNWIVFGNRKTQVCDCFFYFSLSNLTGTVIKSKNYCDWFWQIANWLFINFWKRKLNWPSFSFWGYVNYLVTNKFWRIRFGRNCFYVRIEMWL